MFKKNLNYLLFSLLTIFKIAAFNSFEDAKLAADIICTGNHEEMTIQKVH